MRARRGLIKADRFAVAGHPRREGFLAIWTLLILFLLLSVLAAALNATWFSQSALSLQIAADATALASAQDLISDEWLKSEPDIASLLQQVQQRAQEYAGYNRVLNQPVPLAANPGNIAVGDIVLGQINAQSGGQLIPADLSDPGQLTLDQINAVVIQAKQLSVRGNAVPVILGPLVSLSTIDLQAGVAAMLDQNVIGFRPLLTQGVPLVPLGIRSDPTGTDPLSWENQIIQRNGPDQYSFDPDQGTFTPGADGIPEITVQLQPSGGNPNTSNAYLLQIGTGATQDQVDRGVTGEDLQDLGGQLVLDANNQLKLPTSDPASAMQAFNDLQNCGQTVFPCGAVRIFPLVTQVDAGSGQATVTGFVGARVVKVTSSGGALQLILQPGMLSVPTAVTDASRAGAANLLIPNPYLAKVSLAR